MKNAKSTAKHKEGSIMNFFQLKKQVYMSIVLQYTLYNNIIDGENNTCTYYCDDNRYDGRERRKFH